MKKYKTIYEGYNGMIATWADHGIDTDDFIKRLLERKGKGEYVKEFVEIYEQYGNAATYKEIHVGVEKYNWLLYMIDDSLFDRRKENVWNNNL